MGRVWKRRKYRCVTKRKHRKSWWDHMTKRERQQLREAKGRVKKIDKVAEKYAQIALGLNTDSMIGKNSKRKKIGYKNLDKYIINQKHMMSNKDSKGEGMKSKYSMTKKVKRFRMRRIVTKDWERVWCEFCNHPNPKTLMFCQLCDSTLIPLHCRE